MPIVSTYEVKACVDCVMLALNDEHPTDPISPAPLALLGPNERLVTNDAADDDAWHFSWSPCGACGSTLAGDRTACTVFVEG